MNGLAGNMLRINLKTGEIKKTKTPEALFKEWYGARGVIAKLLYDEVPRNADPLGPENLFIVASGILTGAFIPAGSKLGFGCISPATNGHADSSMGGHLGPVLKFAGYDLIIFEDISPKPVFLYIDNDKVELRDAQKYWGTGSLDCEAVMKKDLGEEYEIATIGPAGENKIYYACISHDFGRQAGRCGVGAVMGSKRVKAIAVRGNKDLHVHDIKGLTKATYDIIQRTKPHPNMAPWQKYGTALFVGWSNEQGTFPTKNCQTSFTPGWESISGEELVEKCVVSDKACFGCWMNCGKYSRAVVRGNEEYFLEGPEYETGGMIGGSCGIKDINEVAYGNYLCDNYGIDTISGGSVVAFAFECFQRGIITKDMVDGRELNWGDIEDFEYLVKKLSLREGIGAILADGTKKAAEKLGHDSIKFAIQSKGVEFSAYESRWAPAQLLSFITADIGAHHNRSWAITVDLELGRDEVKDKAPVVIYLQHIRPIFDTVSICRLFWGELDVMPEEVADSVNYVTDWGITIDDLMRTSERIWNLVRIHYLLRNGGNGRDYDLAPARHWEDPVPDGPAKGKFISKENIELMLDEYYAARGWDKKGNPCEALLKNLSLDFVLSEAQKKNIIGENPSGGIPEVRGKKLKPKAM